MSITKSSQQTGNSAVKMKSSIGHETMRGFGGPWLVGALMVLSAFTSSIQAQQPQKGMNDARSESAAVAPAATDKQPQPPQYCGGGICVDPVLPPAARPSEMQFGRGEAMGIPPAPMKRSRRRRRIPVLSNLAINAKLAVRDCASSWRMRGECGLMVAAMIADAKSTKNFERYYPALREGNPIFGSKPSTLRLGVEGGALTFLQIDAASYVHRNESPRAWWELAYTLPASGVHAYAVVSNEALIAQCKREGVCR